MGFGVWLAGCMYTDYLLRVEEDENIADLTPYDKFKQISSCI